ncbi:GNAT family N-acetyltransferase [Paenibacillus paeoniae]|uniref:GNAT family N-acetyltransferase n=1 Tax=Paenibacillus paeoniae TaxID=2292705 RepID=A0A371PGV6_9BACL|nr:GNAT family N-acetyltransferase [Paenibacillus paeoniae]REK75095.1 GNAT family N-acetyltransferase [Paenibacillus paeoniae]
MRFERVTAETLDTVLDIVNSNPAYNTMENDNPSRTLEEVKSEFLNEESESYFIIEGDKPIGLIDFLRNNPRDNCPWLGLLMIHGDYHASGYGREAYASFEETFIHQQFPKLRIGVFHDNVKALAFWKSFHFHQYGTSSWRGKGVDCLEKQLT